MFGKLRADGTFASISIDGKKYERSGAQRLKINYLASSDAVPHACRADGIEDKEIDIFLKKSRWLVYLPLKDYKQCLFSVSIVFTKQQISRHVSRLVSGVLSTNLQSRH